MRARLSPPEHLRSPEDGFRPDYVAEVFQFARMVSGPALTATDPLSSGGSRTIPGSLNLTATSFRAPLPRQDLLALLGSFVFLVAKLVPTLLRRSRFLTA